MTTPSAPKLLARNVSAVRRGRDPANATRVIVGNSVSTRLESGIVELPLFPSRSRQRDPRPQVGPTVRIHFPPAASHERTGERRAPLDH
jgi:hypothetical protein